MKLPVSRDDAFTQRIRTLEKRLDAIDAARNLNGTTIDEPGSLQVRDANGHVMVYIGRTTAPGQVGLELRRADGSLAFTFEGLTADPSFHETVRLYDRAGNVLVEDDETGGQGLSRPYIPAKVVASADAIQSTTSTSMTNLHNITVVKQHPKIEMIIDCFVDTGSTSGQVDLYDLDNSAVIAGPYSFTGGSATAFNAPISGAHLDTRLLAVRGRRTSAAGSVGFSVRYAIGKG